MKFSLLAVSCILAATAAVTARREHDPVPVSYDHTSHDKRDYDDVKDYDIVKDRRSKTEYYFCLWDQDCVRQKACIEDSSSRAICFEHEVDQWGACGCII